MHNENHGYLWAAGDKYLSYSYKNTNGWTALQILSCKHRTRSTTRQQQKLKDQWVSTGRWPWQGYNDWGDWHELTPASTGAWSNPENISNTRNDVLIANGQTGSISNESWKSSLKSNQSNRTLSYCTVLSIPSNTNNGYQIRCLRE